LKVTRGERSFTVDVAADGEGLVSHAGAGLLAEVADRVGLTEELSRALEAVRERRGRHDPGRVVRDLAVMLADGGDCLSDLRAVRDQEPLFGPVASDSTAFRLIDQIADAPGLLYALRVARARAREQAWELGVRPERLVIDIDATLITAHTEKEGAAVNFKSGFGFHPLLAYLDESREALAGMLRPGGAPAHSAQAQIDLLDMALAQLPVEVVSDLDTEIVMRIDAAGAATTLCQAAQDAGINFLVGFDLFTGVREAILSLPEEEWRPAIRQDGSEREGAQVAEITHVERLDLTPWPAGSRVIIRRERPPPGSAADLHRPRRAPLPSHPDRPHGRRGRDRVPAPRPRARRGSHPRRQADRDREPPLPRVRAQRGVARALDDRPGPDRLDPELVPGGRAGDLRTQSASLPAAAHRRPAGLPRPPRGAAPPSQLALGGAARRRVRPTASTAPAGRLTTSAGPPPSNPSTDAKPPGG
jgi:Transposase DDE domain group 1